MDQLGIARERCRWIVQADAHELPVRTASLQTVGLAFVHTDVDAFDGILHQVARVLQPGGRLVCLEIHPCFVGHHVDSPTKRLATRHSPWVSGRGLGPVLGAVRSGYPQSGRSPSRPPR
jgi:ubiquinone/menaquinone biosynthesis C-methylase UbiE